MYRDGLIKKYLEDIAAGAPFPGGGSVSAFAGALATSMGSMPANFTVGKKKFREVEAEAYEILGRLSVLHNKLLGLTDEDVEAYGGVAAAYGMPRKTPEQKVARTAEIQQALLVAMDVPLRAVRACTETLRQLARLVDLANPNLITDVGVSAILAEAALRGAKMNVDINLAYLKNKELVDKTRAEVETLVEEAGRLAREVVAKVEAKINS